MRLGTSPLFLATDLEAPQALRKVPRHIGGGGTALIAIRSRQPFKQFRCRAGQCDLKVN